jgi:predicted metallopeptidase
MSLRGAAMQFKLHDTVNELIDENKYLKRKVLRMENKIKVLIHNVQRHEDIVSGKLRVAKPLDYEEDIEG